MLDPNFWQDKKIQIKLIKEKKLFEDLINSFENSIKKLNDLTDLHKLAIEENNSKYSKRNIKNLKELRNLVKKNEIKCFLSNEADSFRLLYRNSCWCRRN